MADGIDEVSDTHKQRVLDEVKDNPELAERLAHTAGMMQGTVYDLLNLNVPGERRGTALDIGLRGIRDRISRSIREAIRVYREHETTYVSLKPARKRTRRDAINIMLDDAYDWKFIIERLEATGNTTRDDQVRRIAEMLCRAEMIDNEWAEMSHEERRKNRDAIHVV